MIKPKTKEIEYCGAKDRILVVRKINDYVQVQTCYSDMSIKSNGNDCLTTIILEAERLEEKALYLSMKAAKLRAVASSI